MKISVISNEKTWHINQLKKEAKKEKVDLEVVDVNNINCSADQLGLGEVVLWRSASINKYFGRTTWLKVLENRKLINHGIVDNPFVTCKFFQQKLVKKFTDCNTIETFMFNNVKEILAAIKRGELKFPFIQKPNLGAQGIGVSLINSKKELLKQKVNYQDYVYQNFIENEGDYRVFIVGGKPLGVISRVAKEGGFLNNFSQGGSAVKVEDIEIVEALTKIACKIAALFNLALCGVDIIFNKKDGKYYFLELNTVPQWQGFQGATGVNVSKEIIKLCGRLNNQGKKDSVNLVRDYYDDSIEKLSFDKKFHYYSRMFLWLGSKKYKKKLGEMRKDYIGISKNEIRGKIINILSKSEEFCDKVYNGKEYRKKYIKKYPKLGVFHEILFRALMTREVYGENINNLLEEIIDIEEIFILKDNILKDEKAIKSLSTFAINFIYLVESLFDYKKNLIDPKKLLKIAKKSDEKSVINKIYLLTHCIIGETNFYSKKIRKNQKDVYKEMLLDVEEIIFKNYFDISLDCKFEFLVCCQILGYKSKLENMIRMEGNQSFSLVGNFLIDRNNIFGLSKNKKDLITSEHRNVLFILAFSKWSIKI